VTPRGSRLLTFDLSSLEAQSLRAEKIDTPVETGVIKRPAFAVGVPVGSFNPEESLRSKRLADLKMHRNALAELTQELGITKAMQLDNTEAESRVIKSKAYPDMKIDVAVNRSLIDFYNTYPSAYTNNDKMTYFRVYADTPMI
jgi:hypothetical protein